MSDQTALALPNDVPTYLQQYYKDNADYRDMAGDIQPADVGMCFIKMVQGLSREAKPGWGPTKEEAALPQGTMFLSRDHQIVKPGTEFVPLLRTTRFIKWIGRPGDGHMEGMADRRDDPRIRAENGLEFRRGKNEQGQDITLAPIWTEYLNIFIFLAQYPEEPVVLSFLRSSAALGRQFTQNLLRATKGWRLPLFCTKYMLGKPQLNKKTEHPQFNVIPAGFVKEGALKKLENIARTAKLMHESATAQDYLAIDAQDAEVEETPTHVETPPRQNLFQEPPASPVAPAPHAQGNAVLAQHAKVPFTTETIPPQHVEVLAQPQELDEESPF